MSCTPSRPLSAAPSARIPSAALSAAQALPRRKGKRAAAKGRRVGAMPAPVPFHGASAGKPAMLRRRALPSADGAAKRRAAMVGTGGTAMRRAKAAHPRMHPGMLSGDGRLRAPVQRVRRSEGGCGAAAMLPALGMLAVSAVVYPLCTASGYGMLR